MPEIHGTSLFHQTWDQEGPHQALMRQVWAPTPWMVDVFTDRTMSDRDANMRLWCVEQFGPECWPLHGKFGRWQRGGVTLHGWTWFGFERCEDLQRFELEWPSYPESARAKVSAGIKAPKGMEEPK